MTLASPSVSEASSTVAASSAALRSAGTLVSLPGPRCTRCRLTNDRWQSSFSSATQFEMSSATSTRLSTCFMKSYRAPRTAAFFIQSVHPVAGCKSVPPDARVSAASRYYVQNAHVAHVKWRQAVTRARTCCCCDEAAMGWKGGGMARPAGPGFAAH